MADFENLEIFDSTQDGSHENTFFDPLEEQDGIGENRRAPAVSIPDALLQAEAQHKEEQERDRSSSSIQNNDGLNDIYGNTLTPDEHYEALKRLWVQEVNSTDLLKHDNETISVLMEMISSQEEVIDQFQEQAQNNTSTASEHVDSDLASLAASICKLDLDRICFLLADLTRVRLGKIEKYPFHNVENIDLMSQEEATYLSEYGRLFEDHMRRSVTDNIPKKMWSNLNDQDMIERPNLNTYVFCKVVENDVFITGDNEEMPYNVGACVFARYGVIKDLVSEGKLDILM